MRPPKIRRAPVARPSSGKLVRDKRNIASDVKNSQLKKKQHLTDDEEDDDSYDSEAHDDVVDDLSEANMQILERKMRQKATFAAK